MPGPRAGWHLVCQECWQAARPTVYLPDEARDMDFCESCGDTALLYALRGLDWVAAQREGRIIAGRREFGEGPYVHTVRGETSETGWPYGTTHDYRCPACVMSGASFTASPRSETYWAS